MTPNDQQSLRRPEWGPKHDLVVMHVTSLLCWFVAPLVWWVGRHKDPAVASEARQAFNFQATWSLLIIPLYLLAARLDTHFGLFMLLTLAALVAMVVRAVGCIQAALGAANGRAFRPRWTIRFVPVG